MYKKLQLRRKQRAFLPLFYCISDNPISFKIKKQKKEGVKMTYDNWLSAQTDRFYVSCEPEPDKDGEFTKCLNCESICDDFLEIIGKEKK